MAGGAVPHGAVPLLVARGLDHLLLGRHPAAAVVRRGAAAPLVGLQVGEDAPTVVPVGKFSWLLHGVTVSEKSAYPRNFACTSRILDNGCT